MAMDSRAMPTTMYGRMRRQSTGTRVIHDGRGARAGIGLVGALIRWHVAKTCRYGSLGKQLSTPMGSVGDTLVGQGRSVRCIARLVRPARVGDVRHQRRFVH